MAVCCRLNRRLQRYSYQAVAQANRGADPIIYSTEKARFITAYEVNDDENLEKIINSPDWA